MTGLGPRNLSKNFVERLACLSLITVGILLSGCGSGPTMEQVAGTVTYNGEPIKKGHIVLEPAKGRAARGTIVDGRITDMHTYKLGDGVVVGSHRVSVIAFIREPKGMEVPPSLIPAKYQNPASSGLTAIIESGMQNELIFELTD